MNELLSDKGIKVRLSDTAVEHIIDQGFDPKMGARPLNRKINDLIKVPLSRKILFDRLGSNTTVMVELKNDILEFEVVNTQLMVTPNVDSNGYIVLDGIKS